MTDSCSTCKFGTPSSSMIKCRRFPPTLLAIKYVQEHQPNIEQFNVHMSEDDWCGEYKEKT